jgi:hypothetical protein
MTITLDANLERTLQQVASHLGVPPEQVALDVLRERLLARATTIEPQDEWERNLLAAAKNCGVSLPDSAVSSEGLYE